MKRLAIILILMLLLVCSLTAQQNNRNNPNIYQTFDRGYFIDSRLHGTWVKESNPQLQFVFYSNTWYVLNNNALENSGLFFMNNDTIACFYTTWERNDRGDTEDKFNVFEMTYSLQPNSLLISNMNDYFNGRWNRINTPNPPGRNPYVGTWREIRDNRGRIYQFFNDGTGVFHMYHAPSGYLERSDYFTYNPETRTFRAEFTAQGESFFIEGGKLIFVNHIGQRVVVLDRI